MVLQVKDNQVQDLTKVHHITKVHHKTKVHHITKVHHKGTKIIDSHTVVQVDQAAFLEWADHNRTAVHRESVIQDCSNKISNQDKIKGNLNQRSSHKTHRHLYLYNSRLERSRSRCPHKRKLKKYQQNLIVLTILKSIETSRSS